jgi:hypothetical protein
MHLHLFLIEIGMQWISGEMSHDWVQWDSDVFTHLFIHSLVCWWIRLRNTTVVVNTNRVDSTDSSEKSDSIDRIDPEQNALDALWTAVKFKRNDQSYPIIPALSLVPKRPKISIWPLKFSQVSCHFWREHPLLGKNEGPTRFPVRPGHLFRDLVILTQDALRKYKNHHHAVEMVTIPD